MKLRFSLVLIVIMCVNCFTSTHSITTAAKQTIAAVVIYDVRMCLSACVFLFVSNCAAVGEKKLNTVCP